jgi:hypothetical protein
VLLESLEKIWFICEKINIINLNLNFLFLQAI